MTEQTAVIDVENMEIETLRDLRVNIDAAIASYEDRRRLAAIADAEAAVSAHGFKLADIMVATGKAKTPSVAKYVNPNDKSQTWTGKGRRPAWFVEAIEGGATEESMLIAR